MIRVLLGKNFLSFFSNFFMKIFGPDKGVLQKVSFEQKRSSVSLVLDKGVLQKVTFKG